MINNQFRSCTLPSATETGRFNVLPEEKKDLVCCDLGEIEDVEESILSFIAHNIMI